VQTLASLRLSQIHVDDKLIIKVPDRIKTSAPGRTQPLFSFSPFVENESLCILNLVKHYLHVTKDIRALTGDAFFISYKKPHKAVSSQTISRWLKSVLNDCGVRTDIFATHSTRHASTLLAASKG